MGCVLQHRLHELSETTYRAGAQRNATLVESLTGIETIKAQGAESVIQAQLGARQRRSSRAPT